MANVLTTTSLPVSIKTASSRSISVQRLLTGSTVLLGAIIFFVGVTWDIQWHNVVGRDRTLIPPHVMMLCGVALIGLAALYAVLVETMQVRRDTASVVARTSFADMFHGPSGAYIAGFGALASAIAFPLDAYWHALYGVDVEIWAPFHVMIIGGMVLAALGAVYMLLSAAHIAEDAGFSRMQRAGSIGALVAMAVMINILMLLVFDGFGSSHYIVLPGITLTVFPLLMGLLGSWTFVTIKYAVPWRWAATIVCGVSLLLVLIAAAFIPPAMGFLMASEHIAFRTDIALQINPHLPMIPLEWLGLSLLLSALLLDLFAPVVQRGKRSHKVNAFVLALLVLPGCLPIAPIGPLLSVGLWQELGLGFLVSLLVGGLGAALIGSKLGRGMGEALHMEGR